MPSPSSNTVIIVAIALVISLCIALLYLHHRSLQLSSSAALWKAYDLGGRDYGEVHSQRRPRLPPKSNRVLPPPPSRYPTAMRPLPQRFDSAHSTTVFLEGTTAAPASEQGATYAHMPAPAPAPEAAPPPAPAPTYRYQTHSLSAIFGDGTEQGQEPDLALRSFHTTCVWSYQVLAGANLEMWV